MPHQGGLCVRLQFWTSNQNSREFGENLQRVAEPMADSDFRDELATVAAPVAALTGRLPEATGRVVKSAAKNLTTVIGEILADGKDEQVDFYEGFFKAADAWAPPEYEAKGSGSELVLGRI